MYHAGQLWIWRMLQHRDQGRVYEFELIKYYIANPEVWKGRCLQVGLLNYDNHELRDWREANRPTLSIWRDMKVKYGRTIQTYRGSPPKYESRRSDRYRGSTRSSRYRRYTSSNQTPPQSRRALTSPSTDTSSPNFRTQSSQHIQSPIPRSQYRSTTQQSSYTSPEQQQNDQQFDYGF